MYPRQSLAVAEWGAVSHLDDLTPSELRALRRLKNPAGVQHFLDALPYHLASTSWSPRLVLREQTAHCLEGAIFGAAGLRVLGYPPLLWDLEADNDTDHVLALYRRRGHWGAIATSNYAGCRGREPVYRSLRELAMSYFNDYFNLRGQRSLRRFSRPVDLSRFDHRRWMTAEGSVWFIAEHLCEITHTPLLRPGMETRLARVDSRTKAAGLVGHRSREPTRRARGPRPARSAAGRGG
ncbi:MAG: hypothetical protein A2138_25585 [Deltaproteobacteria bacterium RBG_16_71_12]|nr:MAG: hypothetical protein A2138_25585 [Deltaproteobacteria bacterium RBG_16_71_12]